jgi:hypothetical protein
MRTHLKFLLILLVVLGLLLAGVGAARAAQTGSAGIGWWTLSAGGGPSSGGTVALNATLGQPMPGTFSGGTVQLKAGYWAGVGAGQTVIYLPVIRK